MSRKCKTPAKVLELLKAQQEMMRWIDECLRVKSTVSVENQAAHVKNRSEDYWIGRAEGHNSMLETILHQHNCYAGFNYQAATPTFGDEGAPYYQIVNTQHPEYAPWRVQYYERN
jgi:hypothetical protein